MKINNPVDKCNHSYPLRWILFLILGSRDLSEEHFFILTSNQNRKLSCPLICFQVFHAEKFTSLNPVEKF